MARAGRRAARAAACVVSLLLVLLLWSAFSALSARSDLLAVRADLSALGEDEAAGMAELTAAVSRSSGRAHAAVDTLDQPGPWIVARVPLVGRSLRAERAVANAGAQVLDAAALILPRLRAVELIGGGGVDVVALRDLQAELRTAAAAVRPALAELRTTPLAFTPPQVRRPVGQAREQLVGVDRALDQAADAVHAVTGMAGADRPRSLVVAVMNNAELRGAGGYASSIAVVQTDAGRIRVGSFLDVNAFEHKTPDDAVRVAAPPDYLRRYGVFLANSTLWKNVLMSPHGPDSAAVLCAVARVRPQIPCDGVVLIDVPALARLTELAGPVVVPSGERLSGDSLVRELLVDAYADSRDSSQTARRAALRASADAALRDLLQSGLSALKTVRVVSEAARGRHLVLWSAVPEEQRALDRAGLAGSVDPGSDDLQLTVENQLSASKLDYYVRRDVTVEAEIGRDTARVRQSVHLSMHLPEGLDDYVTGKKGGRLTGLLDMAVSPQARLLRVTRDGRAAAHDVVADTGSTRVVAAVELTNRSSGVWSVEYEVPVRDGRYRLVLLPQPLARPATLTLRVDAAPGLHLRQGPVRMRGPYDTQQVLDVTAARIPWWERRVPRP